ncbi:GntR family transcriptional regulator [Streptomyces sp. NPDC056910]|uniref:GntR family transcriptional regulator n=1 Tax=Streptomyces sp. NPDC056910 TaxID=3345964 RepID=UPI0036A0C5BE
METSAVPEPRPAPGRPRRRQLSEEAADHLRELIMSGGLREGEFLRPERFADELGISVTPVREALLELRAEGFVQQEPRRGFVVLPLTRQDVLDAFLVQAQLAGELAARAAERMGDAELAELRELQNRMRTALAEGRHSEVEDSSFPFHRLINHAAQSPKLRWFMRTAGAYAPRRFFAAVPDWVSQSVREHEDILAALAAGDAEAARRLMHAHIQHSGDLIADHLTAQR